MAEYRDVNATLNNVKGITAMLKSPRPRNLCNMQPDTASSPTEHAASSRAKLSEIQVHAAAQAAEDPARAVNVIQADVDVVDHEVDLGVDVPVQAGRDVMLPAGLRA